MDHNLALDFVRVTEAAAYASAHWVGRGDNESADQAAVTAMRDAFSALDIDGEIVIGEGERDEAPMLFIGEHVGCCKGGTMVSTKKIDIAVDPLEGTNICAKGGINAISVLAAGPKGTLLKAPDTYMDKIAVGPQARGAIDIDASVKDNIYAVADKLGKPPDELTVIILERDRHKDLISQVRHAGARIRLIGDGDVSAAISTVFDYSGIDMLLGIGGAPEGVLAAAALKTLGGDMQGRLKYRNEKEKERAQAMGIGDLDRVFGLDDMVRGDHSMFVATGVTDGPLLKGVRFTSWGAVTNSVAMRSYSGTVRFLDTQHHFRDTPEDWWNKIKEDNKHNKTPKVKQSH
ncbi:MAG: class II fructose-bisphosphatase [Candidatus Omnitrophica bacterium]|nr:class II fructose-bisphosphatase [Candidatus Omnitrophota bacterium]